MKIKPTKTCRRKGCNKVFKIYKTTDIHCSASCAYEDQKAKPRKIQKAIPRETNKRKRENVLYAKKRRTFLDKPDNQICPVILAAFNGIIDINYFQEHEIKLINQNEGLFQTDQIHHKAGRKGRLLNYVPYWLAVSDPGHKWIHANPKKAYQLNFLIRPTTVNI